LEWTIGVEDTEDCELCHFKEPMYSEQLLLSEGVESVVYRSLFIRSSLVTRYILSVDNDC